MNLDNVETFYPLSPAQQGILFHSVYEPSSHAYFGQLGFTFYEGFDFAAFEWAWQQILQRHAVLRTFLVWEGLKEPVQVVRQQLDVTIECHDWRDMSPEAQAPALKAFLDADRDRGLDLSKAPLMRFTLIRLSEETYRFIWSHHHVLIDGWSAPIVLNELLAYYVARQNQETLELPAPRPYRDYILWLANQDPKKAEAYWRNLLKDFREPTKTGLEIKSETPAQPVGEESGAWEQKIEIDAETTQSLQALGRSARLTLNTIVQGAWAILLHKYSGRHDVLYGTTVSGRPPELERADEMVGLFINTLPARVNIRPSDTIQEVLQRMQMQQVETREYEYSRLVDIQGWSGMERGVALFDSIFIFENYPDKPVSNNGDVVLKVGNLDFHQKINYGIGLAASMGSSLGLRMLYDSRKLSAESAAQILRHLANILSEMAQGFTRRVEQVNVLSAGERTLMLETWNGNHPFAPEDKSVADIFAAQVAQHAASIAVDSGEERLTYKELDEQSTQLARYLIEKGIGSEQIVGICLDRSAAMIVSILGVLKAGAAFLPLDAAYPQARLDYMIEDSGACALLTQSKYADRFAGTGKPLIVVDRDQAEVLRQDKNALDAHIKSNHLAYVIYTSGSTGKPKGVMVEQRSLGNFAKGHALRLGIQASSRILQFASFSFDASISEIFPALLNGATLHVASSDLVKPGAGLISLLRERKITHITLPPSLLSAMQEEDVPDLQTLCTAGEACPKDVIARWSRGRTFINAYGPTESTVCASTSAPLKPGDSPNIGKPFPNARLYVLDGQRSPVPVGVAGELYIGGEILARGYLNRPELTAERFIKDPFSTEQNARMYRTGDVVRYLPDGVLEYIGRTDLQVKVRGFRIEPGEIESALEQQVKVSQCLVIVREDVPGDRRLVAYLVARPGESPTAKELQEFLRSTLPEHMVPSAFVTLPQFPLTPAGKINRNVLPAPGVERAVSGNAYLEPRSEAERTIARIWCEVLRLEKVGIDENFFDLGGHSLLMLQVHGKLKEAFAKEISMIQMFGYATIKALAEYFTRDEKPAAKSNFSSIQDRIKRQQEARKKQQEARQQAVGAAVE